VEQQVVSSLTTSPDGARPLAPRSAAGAWRTLSGSIPFARLKAEALTRGGPFLTNGRAPRAPRGSGASQPGTVSLKELQREGLFPAPTNTKPGLYHARAVELVLFLNATLGLVHEHRDPRHVARGRPERALLAGELREDFLCLRHRYCARLDSRIEALEGAAERADSAGRASVLLDCSGSAREDLRDVEGEAEDAFYRSLALRTPQARHRNEAHVRDVSDIAAEEVVTRAKSALWLQRSVDLESHTRAGGSAKIVYRVEIGPDGRPTVDLEAAEVRTESEVAEKM